MRFGYYVNPQTPGPADDGRIIDEVLGQIDLAERLGFRDVWVTEHHFTGYNAYSDPMMLATAIAVRNPSVRIGFSIAIVPLNNPIRFVTQCNLLDQLSKGRLVVGLGPGNSPDEFRGFGQKSDTRHAMLDEWMDLTEKLWANADGPGVQHQGTYYQADIRGRIIPAPYRRPHPMIAWGTTTVSTVAKAGRKGLSLLIGPQAMDVVAQRMNVYEQALDDAGHSPAVRAQAMENTGQLRQIYCAAPGEDWRDVLGSAMETYVRKSALANTGLDDLPREDVDARIARYLQNWLIAGTADELVERLTPVAKCGMAHLMCWFTFGHIADSLVRASMLRFAADVMPPLGAVQPDRDFRNRLAESAGGGAAWAPQPARAVA